MTKIYSKIKTERSKKLREGEERKVEKERSQRKLKGEKREREEKRGRTRE